jgi:hypothetical protein
MAPLLKPGAMQMDAFDYPFTVHPHIHVAVRTICESRRDGLFIGRRQSVKGCFLSFAPGRWWLAAYAVFLSNGLP